MLSCSKEKAGAPGGSEQDRVEGTAESTLGARDGHDILRRVAGQARYEHRVDRPLVGDHHHRSPDEFPGTDQGLNVGVRKDCTSASTSSIEMYRSMVALVASPILPRLILHLAS